ncbi:hypothetical protein UFOVP1533_20 [uncultured Caudovirales phage]|uniref:Uncharacterized protein n=1 Tax=uncultured Caudovirales phage TaxID=2100421 RepID=A0A6J5SF09_9CAUD|nr:hypothetical protein UFOVP1086_20 [uncultured Caudovirales phage]CAB4212577.1 hypothetical protein UFOVP1440_20 [uncultured Caudovirales phage]CAB5228236.1 hypothetical protein UFOVP1533_20 [uncultured Caudovirales phage]
MRLILVISLLMISGCSLWSGKPSEIPPQPDAPIGGVMSKLGDEIDKSESRLAAAVQVASEANAAGKPAVVAAELSVAKSYLPAPTSGDYAYAKLRADKGDPKEYEAAQAAGKRLLAIVDTQWAKMEADAAQAKRISGLKDQRIADLTRQLNDSHNLIWTIVASGLVVIGGLGMAFGIPRAGVWLILTGFATGVYSQLLGTAWFIPGACGMAVIALTFAYFHFMRKPEPTAHEEDKK